MSASLYLFNYEMLPEDVLKEAGHILTRYRELKNLNLQSVATLLDKSTQEIEKIELGQVQLNSFELVTLFAPIPELAIQLEKILIGWAIIQLHQNNNEFQNHVLASISNRLILKDYHFNESQSVYISVFESYFGYYKNKT